MQRRCWRIKKGIAKLLSLKIGAKKGKSIPSEQDTLACNIVLSKRQDLP